MSTGYLVNPDVIKMEQEFNKKAKDKYEEFRLESESNKNITKYEIIIINNSRQAQGMINFIENVDKFIDKYVKIYLYKNLIGVEYFIGPIFIDSKETTHKLLHGLIHFNILDFYTIYPDSIELDMKEYFEKINDPNQLNLYF